MYPLPINTQLHVPNSLNEAYPNTAIMVLPQFGNRPEHMTNVNQALAESVGVPVVCALLPSLSLPESLAFGLGKIPGGINAYRLRLNHTVDRVIQKLTNETDLNKELNLLSLGHSMSGAPAIINGFDSRVGGLVSLAPSAERNMGPKTAGVRHSTYDKRQDQEKSPVQSEDEAMGVESQVAPKAVLSQNVSYDKLHNAPLLLTAIGAKALKSVVSARPDLPIVIRYPGQGDWDMDPQELALLAGEQDRLGPNVSARVEPDAWHNTYDRLGPTLEPVRIVLDHMSGRY